MSDFTIEHNVPIAVPRYIKYPFRDMNIGDSFVCEVDPNNLRSAATWFSKRHPELAVKFSIKKVAVNQYRCWRVE